MSVTNVDLSTNTFTELERIRLSGSAPLYAQREPTFREYSRVIGKHWRFITVIFFLAVTLTAIVVFWTTPIYTAQSTILIERQTPQVLENRQPGTEEAEGLNDGDFYDTQYKILQSRSLIAQAIIDLRLQENPLFRPRSGPGTSAESPAGFREYANASGLRNKGGPSAESAVSPQAIDAYLARLSIKPEPQTKLVTVAFSSPDPLLSARIVNNHIRAYITRGTELRSQASESAEQFLKEKLVELETSVERSEAALNNYRRERGIVAGSSDDKSRVVMERLIDLNKALTAAEADRINLDAKAHLLRTRDYNSLPAILDEPVVQSLKQEQAKVEEEYVSLATEYKPDYPPLADVTSKLHQIRARLNQEMQRLAAGVQWSYTAAAARENELRQEIEEEKKRALSLNDASLQDAILAREVDTNRELYKNILARMNEMAMAAGISASNVSVVDEAQVPESPSSPKKNLIFGLVGLLAVFCGVSGAFFVERFDDSFKDPNEVEYYLGVPSLGLVPDFRKLERADYGSIRNLPNRVSNALLSHLKEATAISSRRDMYTQKYTRIFANMERVGSTTDASATESSGPRSSDSIARRRIVTNPLAGNAASFAAASEAYRAIRIGILLSRPETHPKTILVTSGTSREGKTVTAINIAMAFAEMGSKVLLIDADLRRSRCHEVLGIAKRAGLTELLTGSGTVEEFVTSTTVDSLWCLTAGSRPPNPGELLGSTKMADTLRRVKNSYDCIIIDSAPVMPVTDTLLLTTVADGVLLVVGPRTPKELVRNVCTRLFQLRTNILGVVLNQTEATKHYYYYSDSTLEYAETSNN
jgi:polysaccharide biosynthesis transport protein